MILQHRDKPSVKNTAMRLCPMKGKSDAQADRLRRRALSFKDTPVSGRRTWYLSSRGNDNNAGNSPANAWATLKALTSHEADIAEGDAVLFERGSIFRGHIVAKSGVFYGAFGLGDKPCIYMSRQNYAIAVWKSQGNNLWKVDIPDSADVGNVIFNHGTAVGIRKWAIEDLKTDGDYYYEPDAVWLCMTGNPAEAYESIEMGELAHIVLLPEGTHDVTIENLTLKYGGGMAIEGINDVWNVTIRGCEMGWMGGSVLPGFGDGHVRFGNGIEFWKGCRDVLIEHCWIYQIYDSGFSHQGRGVFKVENLTFQRNLVEYTSFGSIEFWAPNKAENSLHNILYADNILRFAGYGWGDLERPDFQAKHVMTTGSDNVCDNVVFRGNVFDTAASALVACVHLAGELPIFDGNTYIQPDGGELGCVSKERVVKGHLFDETAETIITEEFGDKNAKVIHL